MDISALTNISSNYIQQAYDHAKTTKGNENESFGSVLDAAMNMVNETNEYQKSAEEAEMQFALGLSNNTHDLSVAQEKAGIALQYTVAVRDKVLEAYNTLMNMQI